VTVRILPAVLGALLLLSAPTGAGAHEGEDHGDEPAATSATPAAATSGRLALAAGGTELVAAAAGHDLTIFVDDWATNQPVTNARVNVTIGGQSIEARAIDGTYQLEAPSLDAPGDHRLTFAVTRGDGAQTMAGTLSVVAPAAEPEGAGVPWRQILFGLVAIGLLAGAVLLWRSRQRGSAVALVLAGLLIQPVSTFAHEGDDHGDEKAPGAVAGAAADPPRPALRAVRRAMWSPSSRSSGSSDCARSSQRRGRRRRRSA
jgi:hypothetical protein